MNSFEINRRRLMLTTLAAWLAPWRLVSATPTIPGDKSMKSRISSIIEEYDSQGIHRTGTEIDNTSADWLAGKIKSLGVKPELSSFPFKRIDVRKAEITIQDLVIKGVPLYDGGATDSRGVTGTVGELGSTSDIGVAMSLPFKTAPNAVKITAARGENTHKIIVIVTDERLPKEGIALLNAEDFKHPFGPPVLQVSSKHWQLLQKSAAEGTQATAIVHTEHVESVATNIEATIKGQDPTLAPLVIMTPRSGWWTCASERGGGIACFLELIRSISTSSPVRDVIFTANTGHELGHIGLDHFLEAHPTLARDAILWIHLGANFAARYGSNVRLQFSNSSVQMLFSDILKEVGVAAGQITAMGQRPLGEARNIFDGGGEYVSILGGNNLFHHPSDRWPDAVDLDSTTLWITALVALGRKFSLEH